MFPDRRPQMVTIQQILDAELTEVASGTAACDVTRTENPIYTCMRVKDHETKGISARESHAIKLADGSWVTWL